jgi:hypothetical protein
MLENKDLANGIQRKVDENESMPMNS